MSRLPDKAQTQLDALLEAFRTGEVETAIAKTMIPRHPDDVRPCDAWSLSNRLMCWVSGTADARGYRQWQEVGRHVTKGSKAVYILAPNTRSVTETDDAGEESKRTIVTGFRAVPVFRFEDTDGDDIPMFDYDPPEPPALVDVAERLEVPVQYVGRPDATAYGSYRIDRDSITLFTHDRQTFWHELAHAAHRRVLAQRGSALQGGQQATQEAVAELSAAVLSRMYGAPNDGYSYNYLKGYSGDGDAHRLALKVVADVEKVLALILGQAEKQDGPPADQQRAERQLVAAREHEASCCPGTEPWSTAHTFTLRAEADVRRVH